MPRGHASPSIEYLAAQWRQGAVLELRLCGHVFQEPAQGGDAPAPAARRRWYYTAYFRHRDRGWLEVREARSRLRARTWWKLDDCLSTLSAKGIVPSDVLIHPRAVPADLPAPLPETRPTVGRRPQKLAPGAGRVQA